MVALSVCITDFMCIPNINIRNITVTVLCIFARYLHFPLVAELVSAQAVGSYTICGCC